MCNIAYTIVHRYDVTMHCRGQDAQTRRTNLRDAQIGCTYVRFAIRQDALAYKLYNPDRVHIHADCTFKKNRYWDYTRP